MIHRLFSRPETFALIDDATEGLSADTFDARRLGTVLDEARAAGCKLYTGAFILCANRAYGHPSKHRNHLELVQAMLEGGVAEQVERAGSLQEIYENLRTWPLLGPFMAYQLTIDLNYTPIVDLDEDEFTVPGPGAIRGLAKVFLDLGSLSPAEAVKWLVRHQHRALEEFGITPPKLFGRPLKAIDAQNLLCEVDKYSRVRFPELRSNRTRIKQRFVADPTPLALFYKPSWGINEAATAACASTGIPLAA